VFFAGRAKQKSEAAWRESEERFRLAFESANNGICLVDFDGRVLRANRQMTEIFGYTKEELERMTVNAIAHQDDLDKSPIVINDILAGKREGAVFEKRYIHKNGHVIWGQVSTALIRDQQEKPLYFISHVQDITQRVLDEKEKEKLQAQLRQSQKIEAVGTLAGGIAHDFNNLLQAINGYTQIMLLDRSQNDPDYDKLQEILKAGQRAGQLVRQLLLFSRKVDTVKTPVDINNIFEQTRKMLERTIPKMIEIELHLGSRLWTVIADPVQLEQVLLNLGSNAADAMPDGGRIIMETENIILDDAYVRNHLEAIPGNYVLVTVTDTGHGIDKNIMEHIFDPFFTTKEIGKGTGLGLASVYCIVKSHGGYIHCYSEPSQGTTFKIYLPATEKIDVGSDEITTATYQGGIETILLVDDEVQLRNFATLAFKRFGYQVVTAASGEEALEIYRGK
ncbi:MAG: PAS domain S-box protein, partial [Deltaproteobacteria bacterium]|nr:PAS domain S-box protein [Deltaproteobacteria bacterium]